MKKATSLILAVAIQQANALELRSDDELATPVIETLIQAE